MYESALCAAGLTGKIQLKHSCRATLMKYVVKCSVYKSTAWTLKLKNKIFTIIIIIIKYVYIFLEPLQAEKQSWE